MADSFAEWLEAHEIKLVPDYPGPLLLLRDAQGNRGRCSPSNLEHLKRLWPEHGPPPPSEAERTMALLRGDESAPIYELVGIAAKLLEEHVDEY